MAPETHLNRGPAGPAAAAARESTEIVGERGRRLHVERWAPPADALAPLRPPVVLVHGFGEHVGRYEHLGELLASTGQSTWGFDLAGHGQSEGRRAVVESMEGVLADIDRLVGRATSSSKPVLLGHSMGGAFAAAYATVHPGRLSALVLSAPALHLATSPSWQALTVQALAAVAPRMGVTKIPPVSLSRDTSVVGSFARDRLVWHGWFPARTAVEVYRASRLAFAGAGGLRLPTLMLHGEADPIVPVGSSRLFFAALASDDKHLRTFPGLLHEPFHEVGKDAVIALLVEWLSRH